MEKDNIKAFNWYQEAAENGDRDAQYNLGLCYKSGIVGSEIVINTVSVDGKMGVGKMSVAEKEHSGAQNKLGLFYENGIDIGKDEIKAFYWYQKAAENENKYAQYNLGLCYENGIGIEKDEHKAFYWYQKAAENGNEYAQYHLGLCYENGTGVEKVESPIKINCP
ncbi:uncharacterized protein OCT59_020455 [Rhizophagus irregularis]|uniref:uncharacterized protein n=1 Tax=Rhizophagus irregularis TaxID=588596 RepID=UPI0033249D88|nr:hypothetical protein OCT59_020455 [Rhizophagus irregularis]